MDLHAVKAGFHRIARGAGIIVKQARNLVGAQRAGLFIILFAGRRISMAGRGRRRCGHRRLAVEIVGMNDPSHMPKLQDDPAASVMDGAGRLLPAFGLLGIPDARCRGPAQALAADAGCFADDQAGAGALRIIFGH